MCDITFNEKKITWEHEGQIIKAIIYYCSRDYHAEMIEPYHVGFDGGHLMAMIPMVYVAVDENEHEEKNKYSTMNIVPIVKETCELWLKNMEFNISTERFAIGFSNEAINQLSINDLVEKISPLDAEKKLKKALMKSGEISQNDYQIFLNNTRKTLYDIDKEIVVRGENYVSEHYGHVLANNLSYNVEDPAIWSSKSHSDDGRIDGESIAKNMIVKTLKQQYEKAKNAIPN
ncbi:MAG: hypothetical protein PHT88_05615 [Candidatus Moranbacteria bacterium]|nr:hypothetical protein [Candidatus Moranbacteria bacterium]